METAPMGRRVVFLASLAVAIATALSGAGVAQPGPPAAPNVPQPTVESIVSIDVLSNRADLISGGDALPALRC